MHLCFSRVQRLWRTDVLRSTLSLSVFLFSACFHYGIFNGLEQKGHILKSPSPLWSYFHSVALHGCGVLRWFSLFVKGYFELWTLQVLAFSLCGWQSFKISASVFAPLKSHGRQLQNGCRARSAGALSAILFFLCTQCENSIAQLLILPCPQSMLQYVSIRWISLVHVCFYQNLTRIWVRCRARSGV